MEAVLLVRKQTGEDIVEKVSKPEFNQNQHQMTQHQRARIRIVNLIHLGQDRDLAHRRRF